MAKSYKKNIWEARPEYSIARDTLSDEELEIVSIVQTIESAKKRTPSIPVEQMLTLHENCVSLKSKPKITSVEFEKFLRENSIIGAGTKTLICVLAVITEGLFPPLDIKIAAAAGKKGYITKQEERDLNGTSLSKISSIYIESLTPKWREELSEAGSAAELDEEWGSLYESS